MEIESDEVTDKRNTVSDNLIRETVYKCPKGHTLREKTEVEGTSRKK